MNAVDFWGLLRRCRFGAARNRDEAALGALISALAELSDVEVLDFAGNFRDEVAALDLGDLRDVANQLWVLNDDSWLHLRAWCVSKGPDVVARLRRRCAALRAIGVAHQSPFQPPSGEIFLYCGEYARVSCEVATR